MKKYIFLLIIVIITSVAYFCLGSFIQSKKTDRIIAELKVENQSIKEQIENYNMVLDNNEDIVEAKHPIDIEEEKCIKKTHVYDYPICSQNAEKSWDEEIKNNLNLLQKIMPEDEYKSIVNMHEQWEKSVYNEIDVINRFISSKDGIIYKTEGSNDIVQLKKQYALLLKSIYSNYYEEKEGMF
ncbi:hypothetical protein IJ182_08775 [bacterium]|nr:hypothetical protein [bacterium]